MDSPSVSSGVASVSSGVASVSSGVASGPIRPIFRFDSKEEYLPVTFESYIRESELWLGNAFVASAGAEHFRRVTINTPLSEMYRLRCPSRVNTSDTAYLFRAVNPFDDGRPPAESANSVGALTDGVGAGRKVPTYLDVFALIYTTNGKIGLAHTGEHGFDVERVAIRYADAEKTRPIGMWFGQHNGGYNVPWASVLTDKGTGRPIVYVARNSHAMYPYVGTTQRWFGFGNDVCDGKGYLLSDYTYIPVSRQSYPVEWEYYGGLARDNGQRLPIYRTTGWTEGFGDKLDSGQKWSFRRRHSVRK